MALIIGILLAVIGLVFFFVLPIIALIEIIKNLDESTLAKFCGRSDFF